MASTQRDGTDGRRLQRPRLLGPRLWLQAGAGWLELKMRLDLLAVC